MRIAVTTVLVRGEWSKEAADVAGRLLLLKRILGATRDAELLHLSGGYFRVDSESDIKGKLPEIEAVLKGHGQAVLWGMDVAEDAKAIAKGVRARDPRLPYYGFLRLADGTKPLWRARQLAACSQQTVHFSSLQTNRVVRVGSHEIGVLLCGELLGGVHGRGRTAWWTRDMVRGADVVLDIAHANVAIGGGRRSWMGAIEKCSTTEPSSRPVMVSQHLDISKLGSVKWGAMGQAPRVASQAACCRHVERRTVGPEGHPSAIVDLYAIGRA
ncbi:hypothetical protein [Sorangium sp. So ce1024]|uniref:hypothetical protein n=1 Tax=Sorangium sp. So ce1024 TaxID=3133327 RepID=UPI003F043074